MNDDRGTTGRRGETRQPDPDAAAQDPENARRQQQVKADHNAIVEQARRVDASMPADIRGKSVDQIVSEAERRAQLDRNNEASR